MLKVASFSFDEADKINELLSTYRLAQGAHILVSDGRVIIPFDDGEPKNTAQKIIDLKEQKNTIFDQMAIIEHSQDVLNFLIQDAQGRLADLEANVQELKSGSEKDKAKESARDARNALSQLEAQKRQNDHEMLRLKINVDIFDETIEELSST